MADRGFETGDGERDRSESGLLHIPGRSPVSDNSGIPQRYRATVDGQKEGSVEGMPLEKVLSLQSTPSSSAAASGRASQADGSAAAASVKNAFLPPRDRRDGAAAAVGMAASAPLDAAALSSLAQAAVAADASDSNVATPCFSVGARSPHSTPAAPTLPLRPVPQRVDVAQPAAGAALRSSSHPLRDNKAEEEAAEDGADALAATRRQAAGDISDVDNSTEEEDGADATIDRPRYSPVLKEPRTVSRQVHGASKLTLTPYHSCGPWRQGENGGGGVEGDGHAPFSFLDSGRDGNHSGASAEETRSPPPPLSRRQGAGPKGGSYAGSGCQDLDTAAAMAAMSSAAVTAARFGGGGILRHNPANLAFSGSGSHGGDNAVERSGSSHFSVPSRGAASLSPPYIGVDEENGELAVVFHRDPRRPCGSPTSPSTAAAAVVAPFHSSSGSGSGAGTGRSGLAISPNHLELNNTLDETFGTLVSTMSTTFSTTTNSAGDGEPGSPADTHRHQMAAQMRQALLQTLGLNLSSSGSGSSSSAATAAAAAAATAATTGSQPWQRTDKPLSLPTTTGNGAEAANAPAPGAGAGRTGAAVVTPMRESDIASTYHYVPLGPHSGQQSGGELHHIVTPPASSRNTSSAALNLASSASLLTNSVTSPTVAAQSRSVAAMFAAFTTPGSHVRRAQLSGAATASANFFDIDSGADEDGEGELGKDGVDALDLMRRSLSEEGSRMLSVSVSNPLVFEDLPSSEISCSQPFSAAVQPAPSLQLAYPSHRRSITVDFADFVNSRRSPVSGTPTCSVTKLNTTTDDIFSNSTSSLLPPVLKSTARGGEQTSLEAAAAEAVREVNDGDYAADDEGETKGTCGVAPAAVHPPPLILSPVARMRPARESDADILRASSSSGISPLNIEVAPRMGMPTRSAAAQPLGFSASSKQPMVTTTTAVPAVQQPSLPLQQRQAAEAVNTADVDDVVVVTSALTPAATVATTNPNAARLEWSSHSLSTSNRVGRYRDDVTSCEDDDVSGTATTRGPHSTSSSQLQLQPAGSMTFGEAPEMLLEAAGPINSHSRRDFTSSASTATSIAGARAAAAAVSQQQQQQQQQCHADPALPVATVTSPTEHAQGQLPSRPASTTTTATTNGDLSASTSTRVWMDGIATSAAGLLLRRLGEETQPDEAESPVGSLRRLSQFPTVPIPCLSGNAGSSSGGGGRPPRPDSSIAALSVVGDSVLDGGRASKNNMLRDEAKERQDDVKVMESEDEWGEPIASSPTQQHHAAPQQGHLNTATAQEVEDDDDGFAEPAVAPVAVRHAKHVTFADSSATHFTDPPPSPWTGEDFFYDPNYARMEFKNVADAGTTQQQGEDEDGVTDEEEAALLRAVPHFRFTHRSANGHGSPAPQPIARLSSPSWAAWTRGGGGSGDAGRPTAKADTVSSAGEHQEEATPGHGDGDDDATGGRAPRVFFTKERLASRAALMEARRAAAAKASGTTAAAGSAGSGSSLLSPPPSANTEVASAVRSAGGGLRISLAPPPPTAVPSTTKAAAIAVALPDFAAPVTAVTATSGTTQAALPSVADDGDDDGDGFGGWVQQSPAQQFATAPQADRVTPFTLTAEWCVQRAADLKKRDGRALLDTIATPAAISINTERVAEVLNTVFSDDIVPLLSPSPHGDAVKATASSTFDQNDTDDASEALGATTSTALPHSAELRSVDGVLEALSFVSLAQRSGGLSISNSNAATPVTANAGAPASNNMSLYAAPAAIEDGGFVVPWRTRTSAAAAAPVATTSTPAAGDVRGACAGETTSSAGGDATGADGCVDGAAELADPRLRLTRHLLFPEQSERVDITASSAANRPVSSFMGTRRLPDAPTAAQWTERDVVLAVQQEQRRMAQESEGAVETERLEDVLRFSS